MAKDKKYKNLKINVNELPGIIQAWGLQSEYNDVRVSILSENSQSINYLIKCDDKEAKLNVFPCNGGVYSISPNFGVERSISTLIADYIAESVGHLADSYPYRNGFVIDLKQEDFDAFYELLKNCDDVIADSENWQSDYKFIAKLRNKKYKDSITISYYTNKKGKLVIQGKPLELFCMAIELVSNGKDLVDIINAETKSATITVNGDDVLSDMKIALGDAFGFLSVSQQAILAGAFIFFRTNINVVNQPIPLDYSSLFYPASKALEGYVLKQLVHNNILHENGEALGYYFSNIDDVDPLTLYPQFADSINNDIITREINYLYKLYHRIRHPYSHSTECDYSTPIIKDRKKADDYFKEIIGAINSSYKIIRDAKIKSD